MSNQHSKFLERLKKSSPAVMVVAKWLHEQGNDIEIPSLTFAATAADAHAHVDRGDIFMIRREAVEVKHLGIDFTDSNNWPFPEVFVSNKATVDRANGEVSAYISVSKDMKNLAIVPASTSGKWYIKETRASNTGNMESFYACPIEDVVFMGID